MNRYKDATALRRALETRLKQESDNTGSDLGRLRRVVVFDRLAVRLSVDDGTQWILKGRAVPRTPPSRLTVQGLARLPEPTPPASRLRFSR